MDFTKPPPSELLNEKQGCPRVILLFLKLSASTFPDSPVCPKVKLTRPFVLHNWVRLPEKLQVVAGEASHAGLGVAAQIHQSLVPKGADEIKRMMCCMRGASQMLLSGQEISHNSCSSAESDVVVVPWELSLSPEIVASDEDLERIQNAARAMQFDRIKLERPDNALFTAFLHPDLVSLHIRSPTQPLDFSRLSVVKNLKSLVLVGPKPENDDSIAESPMSTGTDTPNSEEIEQDNVMQGSSLSVLSNFSHSLEQLLICPWFPIDEYGPIVEALCSLKNLRNLFVFGLYQGDQTPVLLASLIPSLPKLEQLEQLALVDRQFWMYFVHATKGKGHSSLKRLVLEWDLSTCSACNVEAALMGCSHLLPNLSHLVLKFTNGHSDEPYLVSNSSSEQDKQMDSEDVRVPSGDLDEALREVEEERLPRLTASKILSLVQQWITVKKHPSIETVTIAGLSVPLDVMERMAKFNFSPNVKCLVEFRSSAHEHLYELLVV